MKRVAIFIIALLFSTSVCIVEAAPAPKQVMFWIKPDISVELNAVRLVFKDVNGQTVYPIIYNGTTYLPVRAVSALMNEPVEWDASSKTVYIGRTLRSPVKSRELISRNSAVPATDSDITAAKLRQPAMAQGYSKPDIFVMYDFEAQTFQDTSGQTVYPLNYEGSVYLPLRAVSRLMGEPVLWDNAAGKISIGNGNEEELGEEKPEEPSDASMALREFFEGEETLYYEASAKITSVKSATEEEKQAIATSASANYMQARLTTLEVKGMDQDEFTEEEATAYDALLAFAESNEYYLLVLENIAYLAVGDQDYSMLADTFLYFALEAQVKMGETRELIVKLGQAAE
jgi:hypothetical protein